MFTIKHKITAASICLSLLFACSGGHDDNPPPITTAPSPYPVPTAGDLRPMPMLAGQVEVGAGVAGNDTALPATAATLLANSAALVGQLTGLSAGSGIGIADMEKIADSIPGDARIAALSTADPATILGNSAPNPHQPRNRINARRIKNADERPFATGKWSKGFFYQSPTRLDAYFEPSSEPDDPRNIIDGNNYSIYPFPNKLWLDDRNSMVSIFFPKKRHVEVAPDPDAVVYDLSNPYIADRVIYTVGPDQEEDMRLTYLPDGQGRMERQIDRFDELTVSTTWKSPVGDRAMQVIAAEGSPYVTVRYQGIRPVIQVGQKTAAAREFNEGGAPIPGSLRLDDWASDNQIVAVATDEEQLISFQEFGGTPSHPPLTGMKFRFVYVANDHNQDKTGTNDRVEVPRTAMYKEAVVYTSAPLTLEWNAARRSYAATDLFDGVLRAAFVDGTPQAAVSQQPLMVSDLPAFKTRRQILDQHRQAYPLASEVRLEYDGGAASVVSYEWLVQRMDGAAPETNDLMMMAFESTQLASMGAPVTAELSYPSNFGTMRAVLGDRWRQSIAVPEMLRLGATAEQVWFGPRRFKEEDRQALQDSLVADTAMLKGYITDCNFESYACGKYLNNIARLVLIADQLGNAMTPVKLELLAFLKHTLQPWLDGPAAGGTGPVPPDFFLYDTTNGGIISERGRKKWDEDYYNGVYVDHMFHYGYYIFASAVLGKYDSAWLAANREKVTTLVRDIGNPSADDPYFPVLRTYDWFRMQNFADSGPDFNGPNTESSSESINANYALMLWGVLNGQTQYQALAAVMTAAEIRNAKAYYQTTPQNSPFKEVPVPIVTVKTPTGLAQQALDPTREITTGIAYQGITQWQIFFGPLQQYLTGIQMLPIGALSSDVLSTDWARAHAAELSALETRQTNLFEDIINVSPSTQSLCYRGETLTNVGAVCASKLQTLYAWRALIASANGMNTPQESYARYLGYVNAVQAQQDLYQANTRSVEHPGSSESPTGIIADIRKTILVPSVDTNVLWWLSTRKP